MTPADARLLRWVLAAFLAGFGCEIASVILAFTWAATGGRDGSLTAAHWLTRCAYGCTAVIGVLGVALGRRERRQARERGDQGS